MGDSVHIVWSGAIRDEVDFEGCHVWPLPASARPTTTDLAFSDPETCRLRAGVRFHDERGAPIEYGVLIKSSRGRYFIVGILTRHPGDDPASPPSRHVEVSRQTARQLLLKCRHILKWKLLLGRGIPGEDPGKYELPDDLASLQRVAPEPYTGEPEDRAAQSVHIGGGSPPRAEDARGARRRSPFPPPDHFATRAIGKPRLVRVESGGSWTWADIDGHVSWRLRLPYDAPTKGPRWLFVLRTRDARYILMGPEGIHPYRQIDRSLAWDLMKAGYYVRHIEVSPERALELLTDSLYTTDVLSDDLRTLRRAGIAPEQAEAIDQASSTPNPIDSAELPGSDDRDRHPSAPPDQQPIWDRPQMELRFGDVLCRKFARFAPDQFRILDEFQNRGWPVSIPNPFRHESKLKDAIKDLETSLNLDSPISFRRDKAKARWSLRDNLPASP